MKFTCEKALLVSALSVASRTVAQKSTIPCLEGVLLRAGVALQLTGYNLETGITVHVGAQIQEAGSCVMPARLFFDIVRKLPDEMVSITVDHKQQVSIRAGAAFFQITAMDSEDYPELPDVNGKSGVTMPQSALKAMISGTIFSVSENQARPIQTGCLMEVTEDSVTMVAVDSFRLARRTWHTENAANHTLKFVVPAAGLKEIERILEDSDEPVTFTLGDKHILFSIGDALLVSRVLEGEFIDWRRVVPTNCGTVLTANVAELTSSIERVSLIISEKVKSPVRCVFGDNMADFRTANTIGSAHDTCSIAGNGGELEPDAAITALGGRHYTFYEYLTGAPRGGLMEEYYSEWPAPYTVGREGRDAADYTILFEGLTSAKLQEYAGREEEFFEEHPVSRIQIQGICPYGWHVANFQDWYDILYAAYDFGSKNNGGYVPKEPSFANTVYGSSSAAYKINVVPYLRISRALWTVGGKCLWDEAGSLYPVNEGSTTKSPAQADIADNSEEFGFNLAPTGWRAMSVGWQDLGLKTHVWIPMPTTATYTGNGHTCYMGWRLVAMTNNGNWIFRDNYQNGNVAHGVRCVKNYDAE